MGFAWNWGGYFTEVSSKPWIFDLLDMVGHSLWIVEFYHVILQIDEMSNKRTATMQKLQVMH